MYVCVSLSNPFYFSFISFIYFISFISFISIYRKIETE
jgi:hypothetical protein